MHNYKLTVSYDGGEFSGWQKAPGLRTVEHVLQETLEKKLQHPVVLQAASRTDAGVHARGQVVNFFSPLHLDLVSFCISTNKLLPDDLRLLKAELMDASFHPTLSNTGKEYRYKIRLGTHQIPLLRKCAWHVYYPADTEAMKRAAEYFVGTHDFAALSNVQSSPERDCTIRTVRSITFHELDDHLEIRIIGDSFLYKMVRNLVGTIVDVGIGKLSADEIPELIQKKERPLMGVTAPAHGLTLYQLFYD